MDSDQWRDVCRQARDLYGDDYLFRMMAEECLECAHAALKYLRAVNRETPMTVTEARRDLIEEMADAYNMIDAIYLSELSISERRATLKTRNDKQVRMRVRMEDRERRQPDGDS